MCAEYKLASNQARNVYCFFIGSHAVRHTKKLLRFRAALARNTSRCLQCIVRAATRGLVFLCLWIKAPCVYPACICTIANVCVHTCLLCTEFPKRHVKTLTDVRKPRHSASDKQTMPGGGSKQCAAIALLLSVCPRCHVTEALNAIKAFTIVQHRVCVRVFALAEAPL